MNYNKIEQDNKIRIWAIYYKNGKNQEDINKKINSNIFNTSINIRLCRLFQFYEN